MRPVGEGEFVQGLVDKVSYSSIPSPKYASLKGLLS
jgi:hypothetical protein